MERREADRWLLPVVLENPQDGAQATKIVRVIVPLVEVADSFDQELRQFFT